MTVSLADLTPVLLACMPAHRDCTLGTVLPNVTEFHAGAFVPSDVELPQLVANAPILGAVGEWMLSLCLKCPLWH